MNVYKKFENHFSDVSAYVIMQNKNYVGKIVVKHTRSGVAHVYLHEFGYTMTSGKAGGYGYDKVGAALGEAAINSEHDTEAHACNLYKVLKQARCDGEWMNILRDNGYEVFNAL